jgi:hypothetical protein
MSPQEAERSAKAPQAHCLEQSNRRNCTEEQLQTVAVGSRGVKLSFRGQKMKMNIESIRASGARGAWCSVVGALVLTLDVSTACASDWSDTFLGYRHGTKFREPFNVHDIKKDILSVTHASGYTYGSNFFTVDMIKSDANDPVNGGGGGAHEAYAVYRTTLSGSKVLGWDFKNAGFIRDVGLTAGFDFGAKNDQFSPRAWKTAIGPKVSFNVPGFWDVALVHRTERSHNWFATGPGFGGFGCVGSSTRVCNPDVHFKNTFAMETAWLIALGQLGVPAKFQGFLTYIGKKGKDGTGADTAAEAYLEASLMFDVGSLAGRKDAVFAGVGYQYWRNKFGSDSSKDPTGGSIARTPQLQLEWHF